MSATLAEATEHTEVQMSAHLEAEARIPVTDGLQAQGDIIVIPATGPGDEWDWVLSQGRWEAVPATGIEVLRGDGSPNPHVLVADPDTCRWCRGDGLTLGWLIADSVVYLLHPEHGAIGLAPGRYGLRRQRRRAFGSQQADMSYPDPWTRPVAD